MASKSAWQREQLLLAFHLYCRMPFGKMHKGNAAIIRYAALIGRTPSALAMKLTNIASLDPAITGTGRKGLAGASFADRAMWNEMQENWEQFFVATQQAIDQIEIQPPNDSLVNDVPITESNAENYEGREKLSLAKSRIGQAFFRAAVLSAYDNRCCISGFSVPQLLIASHIVPWRIDEKNRLNPKNGLCLSILHDKAFDLGLIGITENLTVQISPKIKQFNDDMLRSSILKFEGQSLRTPKKFLPDLECLSFHRKNIFISI